MIEHVTRVPATGTRYRSLRTPTPRASTGARYRRVARHVGGRQSTIFGDTSAVTTPLRIRRWGMTAGVFGSGHLGMRSARFAWSPRTVEGLLDEWEAIPAQ